MNNTGIVYVLIAGDPVKQLQFEELWNNTTRNESWHITAGRASLPIKSEIYTTFTQFFHENGKTKGLNIIVNESPSWHIFFPLKEVVLGDDSINESFEFHNECPICGNFDLHQKRVLSFSPTKIKYDICSTYEFNIVLCTEAFKNVVQNNKLSGMKFIETNDKKKKALVGIWQVIFQNEAPPLRIETELIGGNICSSCGRRDTYGMASCMKFVYDRNHFPLEYDFLLTNESLGGIDKIKCRKKGVKEIIVSSRAMAVLNQNISNRIYETNAVDLRKSL